MYVGMLDGVGGTGILSQLKYLNTEHELPQIGIRQQHAKNIKAGYVQAEMHRDYEPAQSDIGWTQVKVDIDSYPSRTAYGFLNNTDFAKKYGQQGLQDVAAFTSKTTNEGWNIAKNAAKPGRNVIAEIAKSDFYGQVVQWPKWTAKHIPDPEITVTPSETKGQMNVGHDRYNINATPDANIQIQTGSAETYIAKEGSIRHWITEGQYDIRI